MNTSVPRYQIVRFKPKQANYALAVYAINENKRLERELVKIKAGKYAVDVILADGGSTDGSTKHSLLKKHGVTTLLVKKSAGGLSAQMRMAFDYCLKQGYQGIICIDGNNKDDPAAIPLFIEKLKDGYDHIQGSRFLPGGRHENTPLSRLLGLKLIHVPLIRLASGFPYTDTTNGFRGYSMRLLEDETINIFRPIFSKYELHYYLAIESVRKNYKVMEIPVTRIYPKGKVPTKIKSIWGLVEIIKVLIQMNLGYYR